MKQFLWKIGGEAGFGILTTGIFFSKIATRLGYYIFDFVQYPSLIRGGHNTYDVGFSDEPVHSLKQDIDMLVCLNKDTFILHKNRLTSSSIVLYDREEFIIDNGDYTALDIPFRKTLTDLKGQAVMKNTIALGASLALLGAPLDELNHLLEQVFGKKGDEVVSYNKQFGLAGYMYVSANLSKYKKNILTKRNNSSHMVISGNEAFALGSVIAGCTLYAAYPMTPASSVLTVLAGWMDKTGMVVRHAEDEISVINTALGSSIAGARSSIGTSGGGFALMVESLSFAGVAEIPLVVLMSQRPGPATGMPTWTEQGDLLFTVHAGHGEFPKIVLAPGDVEEMVDLTVAAYDFADIYQTPVIVMSDMLLSESHNSLAVQKIDDLLKTYKPNRGKTVSIPDTTPYLRYKITDDGISPRLVIGYDGVYYQSNSYEHLEDGHTTEEAEERIKQVDKRARKMKTYLKNHFKPPRVTGDIDTAHVIFVSWGSTKGAVAEACRELDNQGVKNARIHFSYIYPLDEEAITPLFAHDARYILVENNSEGQLGKLLKMETGTDIKDRILRYDGRPITSEQIISYAGKK